MSVKSLLGLDKNKKDIKASIPTSEELRKIQNDAAKKRLEKSLNKIRNDLEHCAEYARSPIIMFPHEFESEILNQLAKSGLSIDLSSRVLWDYAKIEKVFGEEYSAYKYDNLNNVEYKVSF